MMSSNPSSHSSHSSSPFSFSEEEEETKPIRIKRSSKTSISKTSSKKSNNKRKSSASTKKHRKKQSTSSSSVKGQPNVDIQPPLDQEEEEEEEEEKLLEAVPEEVFAGNENMTEEMDAMKEVFMRMSRKKIKQKEDRKKECKRMYLEAFKKDVNRYFQQSKKKRQADFSELTEQIDNTCQDLCDATNAYRDTQETYSSNFNMQLQEVQRDVEHLRKLKQTTQETYEQTKKELQQRFKEAEAKMEKKIQKIHLKMVQLSKDKSYMNAFKPQLERIL